MKDEFDQQAWIEDEEAAVRALAYLHGELGEFEAEQFEHELESHPEWQPGFEAMKKVVEHGKAAFDASDRWKLSSDKREALLEKLGAPASEPSVTVVEPEPAPLNPWLQLGAAAAVVTVVLGGTLAYQSQGTKDSFSGWTNYPPQSESMVAYSESSTVSGEGKNAEQVPLLGDLPVLRGLFGSKDETQSAPSAPKKNARLAAEREAGSSRQIAQSTKFLEARQSNREELGFDWMLSDESTKADLDQDGFGFADEKGRIVRKEIPARPAAPSAPSSRAIAANEPSPVVVPVPEIEVPDSNQNFGDGNDFGDGWGESGAGEKVAYGYHGSYKTDGRETAKATDFVNGRIPQEQDRTRFDLYYSDQTGGFEDQGLAANQPEPYQTPPAFYVPKDNKDYSSDAWPQEKEKKLRTFTGKLREGFVTGGNRSGQFELSDETLDDIVNNPDRNARGVIEPVERARERKKLGANDLQNKAVESAKLAKLMALRESLDSKGALVDERREGLTRFTEENSIIYVPGSSLTVKDREFEDYVQSKVALAGVERGQVELSSQIKSLEAIRDDQLAEYAAQIDLPENVVKRLYPELEKMRLEKARAQANGLGADHPSVVAIDQDIEALDQQIQEGIVGLRDTLRINQEQLEARAVELRKMVEIKKQEAKTKGMVDQKFRQMNDQYERELAEWKALRDQMFEAEKEVFGAQDEAKAEPVPAAPIAPAVSDDETLTSDEEASTFSLHVGEVSFQMAANALLQQSSWPESGAVRPEEFYNGFELRESEPRGAVACEISQSEHPFAQGRNLMRLGVRAGSSGRAMSQPLNLVILLDQSGSMQRYDRQATLGAALRSLASLLGPQDRISVIGFARTSHLLADRLTAQEFQGRIGQLVSRPAEGGTNLELAIGLSGAMADRMSERGGQTRVVLFTDGAANLGQDDPEQLRLQVEGLRQRGIALDACGIGLPELDDDKLAALSKSGDGRYYALNQPDEADAKFARQLAGAFRPAAKDLKVQVVFNPARVPSYRLVGFDDHLLAKEDFRNDAVDAAEIASAETGNAIYEYQVNDGGSGAIGEVFVRFKVPETGQVIERSWTIPYQSRVKRFEESDPAHQLLASAGFVAERLRGGRAGARVELDQLEARLAELEFAGMKQEKLTVLRQMVAKMRQMEAGR